MPYSITFAADIWPMINRVMLAASGIYTNRVYQLVAPKDTTFPCLIYQSQDLGGDAWDKLGTNGWRGQIALRSIDRTNASAARLLAQTLAALGTNVQTSGLVTSGVYNVSIRPLYPIPLPVERLSDTDLLYTAAVAVEMVITPST